MGREIRRVPPNWKHPTKYDGQFQPMMDSSYIDAINDWISEHNAWEAGTHPALVENPAYKVEYPHFANYSGNAPDIEHYRPNWKPEEMTWFQVYETVSEGTPVTPPFETREELVEYLVEIGDFWDQKRRDRGCTSMPCDSWARKDAEKFVFGNGWMPSMTVQNGVINTRPA